MADFTSGVNETVASPQNVPIVPPDTSDARAISAFGSLASAVGQDVMEGYVGAQKQKALDQKNKVLSNLEMGMLQTSSAYAQGKIKSRQAAGNLRKLAMDAIKNNPSMTKSINDLFVKVAGHSGLAGNIQTGLENEQDQEQALVLQEMKNAQSAQYIHPGMSEEEVEEGLDAYRKATQAATAMAQAEAQIDFYIKRNAKKKSDISLVTAGITQSNARLTHQSKILSVDKAVAQKNWRHAAASFVTTQVNKTRTRFNLIKSKIGTEVPDPTQPDGTKIYTRADAIKDWKDFMAGTQAGINSAAVSAASGSDAIYISKPLMDYMQTSLSVLDGSAKEDVANQAYNTALAQAKANMLNGNPKMAPLLAASTVAKNSINLQSRIGDQVITYLDKNGLLDSGVGGGQPSKPADLTSGTEDEDISIQQYLNGMKQTMSDIMSGNGTPEDEEEVSTHLSNILSGTSKYGSVSDDPSDFKYLVDFFASPQFGSYVSKHPEVMQTDNAQRAIEVLHDNYTSRVIPAVKQAIATGSDRQGNVLARTSGNPELRKFNTTGIKDYVSPHFNGVGVSFRKTPKSTSLSQGSRTQLNSYVDFLNKDVAPVFNKIVRANANLSGTRNAKQSYEKLVGDSDVFGEFGTYLPDVNLGASSNEDSND